MTSAKLSSVLIPDRFEGLQKRASDNIKSIVVPVEAGLQQIDRVFRTMSINSRGAFVVLRGESGTGKSTFLHTLRLYRKDVESISIPGVENIREYFSNLTPSLSALCVYVMEEREAATSFRNDELEEWLHAINAFIRSSAGENAIVVWPCNTDELEARVTTLAQRIGGDALLPIPTGVIRFVGPERSQYQSIAESTLAVLNQGATFSDLGVTHDEVTQLSESSDRIGTFLHKLNQTIIEKEEAVSSLVEEERCSLLIVVVAGNDPIGDVNSLTRGRFASADTERLMASTDANIVVDLKRYPEKVGVLATVLNSKIVCLPSIAALSVARAFGDERLKDRMKSEGLSLVPAKPQDAINRILSSEVAVALKSTTQRVLARGPKVGSSTKEAFSKLAKIASTNDQALNRALGTALVASNLVTSFEIEKDFGTGLSRRTDIVCALGDQIVRIEVMWRNKTGRADIANYTLGKVANYARAIGFMD